MVRRFFSSNLPPEEKPSLWDFVHKAPWQLLELMQEGALLMEDGD